MPRATPVTVDLDTLATYVGPSDSVASVSESDKQAAAQASAGPGTEMAMQDGVARFRASYPSGPAAKAGVMAGDIITHVDDMPIKDFSLSGVVGMLRGP